MLHYRVWQYFASPHLGALALSIQFLKNPLRGEGLSEFSGLAKGEVETDARAAQALYEHCPAKHATPLQQNSVLADQFGVAELWLKMEDQRMGLGSFKALGAAHAIAKLAALKADPQDAEAMATALEGETFICASAGNHGLSVAAGAKLFGARAVVLLSQTVPEGFADRLREKGCEVVRAGKDYEASMEASKEMAAAGEHATYSQWKVWQWYTPQSEEQVERFYAADYETPLLNFTRGVCLTCYP